LGLGAGIEIGTCFTAVATPTAPTAPPPSFTVSASIACGQIGFGRAGLCRLSDAGIRSNAFGIGRAGGACKRNSACCHGCRSNGRCCNGA
jgi:hypothetical protein